MVTIKTPKEIEILKEAGAMLAGILAELTVFTKPGTSTLEINDLVNKLCTEKNVTPVFLNYTPHGADRPYPASICVSINDEIVHGIPNESPRILKEGDIVSLDMGIQYKKLIVDSAVTVPVGKVDDKAEKLLQTTKDTLFAGIAAAKAGAKTGDIGFAIEQYVKSTKLGYGIAEDLGGHGVGYSVHEDPFVPNFGKKGQGVTLKPGMVIAIEPMLNEGSKDIIMAKDGYTFKTADGLRSAHFEHTIVITDGEPEILTK